MMIRREGTPVINDTHEFIGFGDVCPVCQGAGFTTETMRSGDRVEFVCWKCQGFGLEILTRPKPQPPRKMTREEFFSRAFRDELSREAAQDRFDSAMDEFRHGGPEPSRRDNTLI